ncbi:hypothetical protein GALL_322920 [mine drainage metagenome]|uniref:Uncharacterized protein n=1 Tax=mine drainage metagenome TaxID=410659 RepID=A0A1J5QQK5_9ZZZZ
MLPPPEVPCDGLGRGLHADRLEARVCHATDCGAADHGRHPDDGRARRDDRVADPGDRQDGADRDHRVRRRKDDDIGVPQGLDDSGCRNGVLEADLHEASCRQARPVPYPPLLEVQETLPGRPVVHDHVGLDLLVRHRQEGHAGLPPTAQVGRDGGQRQSLAKQLGAGEVGREVEVAECEPLPPDVVGGEVRRDAAGLVTPSPALVLVHRTAEGVHQRVEVGADPDAVQPQVVSGVRHDRDGGGRAAAPVGETLREQCLQAPDEPSAAHAAGDDGDLHAGPPRFSVMGLQSASSRKGGSADGSERRPADPECRHHAQDRGRSRPAARHTSPERRRT